MTVSMCSGLSFSLPAAQHTNSKQILAVFLIYFKNIIYIETENETETEANKMNQSTILDKQYMICSVIHML